MVAYNVVRFRVKPGMEQQFIDGHRIEENPFQGFLDGALIDTGNRTYCFVAKWRSYEDIVASRPAMIAMLDRVRPTLEDLGGGLGVTDPVSGTAAIVFPPGA
jgi:hypothetical protein